jgi:Fe-S-cluster containining protein
MENEEMVTGRVTLRINGEPVEMEMTVPAKPVKPHRMLPVLQKLTNAFVGSGVDAAVSEGRSISCKAGCGACCRQGVPISEAEVYQIAELVDLMPEPRRTIIRERFSAAAEHFKKIGWADDMEACIDLIGAGENEAAKKRLEELVLQYFYEGVACPFLEDEACSIHEDRPLACREYLVTSPAENCSAPSTETIRIVGLSFKPSHALKNISKTGRLTDIRFLPLVRALEVADTYPEDFVEKTGSEWMMDFFNDITGNTNGPMPGAQS